MFKPSFANLAIIAAIAMCRCGGLVDAHAAERPNIIFLFADDLGWGDLSCYGQDRVKTPNLDRLAQQGTLFTNFYVAGSVCSPSRTGIMTGQYPARHRVFGHFAAEASNAKREMPNALDPDIMTLTDLLKDAGYRTAHFGKWHLGNVSPEEYGVGAFRTESHTNIPDRGRLDIWNPPNRPKCTADILDAALEFMDSQQATSEPFFLNAWFSDPHATLNPSLEQLERVKQFAPKGVDFYGVAQVFYACVVEMDRQIGRFLDELDARGLSENTLVIFSSDNGPEDFQIGNSAHSGVGCTGPFRGRKRSIYEGGIRTPFLLRWPGKVPPGKVNDTSIVNGIDLLPTLAAIAEADIPASLELDGENMLDVWLGKDRQRSRPLFWEWRYRVFGHPYNQPPRLAVREGDFKLLINPDQSRVELYNLRRDPGERDNIASEHREKVNQLQAMLLNWNESLPKSPVEPVAGKANWRWPQ
ncbi:sulfatase family protein [Novipirellula artificiosorum]|uniref:Arylsulfatase n=1 Tax=Novipirellula artificiosorum TaxID=2528016 RepID=A0A5C6E1R0_9BACT|nr:sulfatase-like hydrolase/transferase [Novipirellula artificiosorum]TWU41927.1 Arylsulfatase precursor [Novipirellula artificiosorum]